jgi:hypothetical protein
VWCSDKINNGDKNKNDEMGGEYNIQGGNTYKFLAGKPERTGHLGDLGIGGRVVLQRIVDWVNTAQDRTSGGLL